MERPVPIPNTEVKHPSVDDSCGATYRENKSLRGHLSSEIAQFSVVVFPESCYNTAITNERRPAGGG